MICSTLIGLFLISLTTSLPVEKKDICTKVLKSAHASENFGENVAHALHSITVRELRKFESNVTEENNIPTINVDLTSDQAILPYAPDRRGPNEDLFSDDAMKTVDEVLSHMDDPNYMIKGYNTIERLVHAFHMKTMWVSVREEYEKIKMDPPKEVICHCVLDIENNEVLNMLRYIALVFREPQLIYGNKMKHYEKSNNTKHTAHLKVYANTHLNDYSRTHPDDIPKTILHSSTHLNEYSKNPDLK
uniref:Uncharacterized protein n=1 Tax=Acrobeloides nanus TaxID=290746 RepID=A0A914C1M5_9BILA